MKIPWAFFLIGLLLTLVGLFVGGFQSVNYQSILSQNNTFSYLISDQNDSLFTNSFGMKLQSLEFDNYASGSVKNVNAIIICEHQGEHKNIDVSINHPAHYYQYQIYLKDYKSATKQSPAMVRLLLVRQPAQWMVYLGVALLMLLSLFFIVQNIIYGFKILPKKAIVGLLCLVLWVLIMIVAFNPMMHSKEVPPILRSVWFIPHVAVFVLSYALLLFSFIASCIAFKKQEWLSVSQLTLSSGVHLFTIGLALGMIWAKMAWGDFWGWDPKETAALITWVAYGGGMLYIKENTTRKQVLMIQIVCLLCLLFCWFGVWLFKMGGLHVY